MKTLHLLILTLLFTGFNLIGQELAMVMEGGKIGYIDKSGAFVIQPKFAKAASFSGKLAAAEKDKKWGYINTSGEWAIEPIYEHVKKFNSNIALVQKDKKWGYIDTSGKTLEVPASDKYYDFKDGVAIFREGEKIGLLGTNGAIVLKPKYDAIKKFWDGHAKVKNNDLWGMINAKGEETIPVEYTGLGSYNPSGIWARKGTQMGLVVNGSFKAVSNAEKIYEFKGDSNLTYASDGDKVGFINNQGEWVIKPAFDKARSFSNGLAPVMKDKKWGYITEKGEVVIDYQFKDAELFSDEGLAPVKEKKWGFIDKSGKLVIPMDYDISAGFSFLKKNAQKGFNKGLARVKTKKGWTFLKTDGTVLGGKWYKNAENFVNTNK